ncbi:MAG: MFS transporter [Lentisphaeria bacterium]|nr:MFS transporter [Lentisphaeria bacterium]
MRGSTTKSTNMLFRFSLYGFLKNQRYFEPFLILIFREKGMSFAMIGVLIAFREVCVNVFEIPTGAIADVLGRRKSMVVSFSGYILSFAVFATSLSLGALFVAMLLFAVGEAFRTGTHKAMIFDWLEREGRGAEKTAVYGYTRSWSKKGSALCVVISAIIVWFSDTYTGVFWMCLLPYVANVINLWTYPAYLDGDVEKHFALAPVVRKLRKAVKTAIQRPHLRRILLEAMGFEGCFKSSQIYLQPLLLASVVAVPMLVHVAERKRTAVLVGAVYAVLHLLSAVASRNAKRIGGDKVAQERGALGLWRCNLVVFGLMLLGALLEMHPLMIACLVFLAVLQNLWRPLLVSRCADETSPDIMATVLSIESQGKAIFVVVFAPLLGFAVDWLGSREIDCRFAPVAVLGCIVSAIALAATRRTKAI